MKQIQQEHYSGKREEYQLVIPLELGVKIGDDEPIRLLSRVMEEIDYSKLKAACSYWGRKGKASPRHLAKVTIFGYRNGTTSTRGLEEACWYDLRYQWLLEGRQAPDHNTIATVAERETGGGIGRSVLPVYTESCMTWARSGMRTCMWTGRR